MLITGNEILTREFLKNADAASVKNACYYLQIETIIPAGKSEVKFDFDKPLKSLILEPRDIAWIVSKEEFNLSEYTTTALVTLRSSFTKQGLLALDVGLVDPGYKGPIGSIVINFSSKRVTLAAGDKFFRVIFLEHKEIPNNQRTVPPTTTSREYIRARHDTIVSDFSSTFLGETRIADKILDEVLDQVLARLLKRHWVNMIIGTVLITSFVYLLISDTLNNSELKLNERFTNAFEIYIEEKLPANKE